MAAQRGFFSWWFGELREFFSGRPMPVHALAMSDHEVALLEKGVDTPIGVVDIQAEDWREQIEGLRTRILRRRGRNPLVEIQLPADQVMFAKVKIGGDENRERTVRGQLAELTGHDPNELVFDIAQKPDPEGRTVVAIAPISTVTEAARFVAGWGFDPARVTSIESPVAFRRGPEFEHEGTRIAGSPLPKIAAVLAIVAICLAGAAAARALSIRADLADEARQEAAAMPPLTTDQQEQELTLAQFANAAATATDLRDITMPVWRVVAEVASIIPGDVALTAIEYKNRQMVLRGTTKSTVALEEALDRSPLFNAPTLSSTGKSRTGRAKFVMEVTIDEGSAR